MKKIKAILIGAGGRGKCYTDFMADMPDKFDVVAVAEPVDSRREYIRNKHNIPEDMCFADYKSLLALGKIADLSIIATMDREHFEPAMMSIDCGYDLLLEKPIAPTAQECYTITKTAEEKGVKAVICTVLRYTPVFNTLKNLIDEGKLGRVMSIDHEECVGNIHQSHSFVRGNWGNSSRSSTMLLQKSCHDIDILQWLIGKKCLKVQSFGMNSFFNEKNAPEGSPERCIDGCPVKDCPYNAVKLYLESDSEWFRTACTSEADPDDAMVEHALRTNMYGRCVFKCDNDVVDHQTVNLLFEDDITVTFTMNAFNKGGRFIHIMGTKAEVRAAIDGDTPITLTNFITGEVEEIPFSGKDGVEGGHGGGDIGIVNDLYYYLTGQYDGKSVPEIKDSCYNHLVVFAAEKAREDGTVVDVEEFINSLN